MGAATFLPAPVLRLLLTDDLELLEELAALLVGLDHPQGMVHAPREQVIRAGRGLLQPLAQPGGVRA